MRAATSVIVGLVALTACSPVPPPGPAGPAPRSTPTPDLTPATVRVGHVPSTQWAPLYMALDRGYFDELNVKVQLQAIRLGQDPGGMVARGEVDAVVTDLSARVFNELASGSSFRIVGSMAAFPADGSAPVGLEVSKELLDDGKVKTLADLKGRNVAIQDGAGSGSGHLVDLMLRKAGISLKDMTVVNLAVSSMAIGFEIHSLDSALVPAYYATGIEQQGLASLLATPPPGTTWSGLLFNSKFTGWTAQRFFDALVRAARDLADTPRASADTLSILTKYTGLSGDVLGSVPQYAWNRALRPDVAAIAGLQSTYRDEGLLGYGADLPAASVIDGSYSRAAPTMVR